MTHSWEDDALILGLTDAIPGSRAAIPQPDRRVGEGRGVQPDCTLRGLIARDFQDAVFLHAALAELDEVGLQMHVLEANPRVLKVSSADGGKLDVIGSRAASSFRDLDDPGTVFVQVDEASVAVVTTSGRCGVVIDREAQGLTQVFLPLEPESFSPIVSPAAEWIDADPWLRDQILRVVQEPDPLRHVRAAGMAKRLADLASSARSIVDGLVAGVNAEVLSRPHGWFRSLAPQQIRAVERLACERAELLAARLAATHIESGSLDVALLHERDDLEGARVLLGEVGAGRRLEARLGQADQVGIRLAGATGFELHGDERLRRVHALDGLAWWARTRSDAS